MTPPGEIVIVDFGMGNLRNVARAFERAGARARVSADADEARRADRLVVPGVGACGDAMAALREAGLDAAIREFIITGRPFLGICLGLHVLLQRAEEGAADCLGVIPGSVEAFPADLDLPVPHMGWNLVKAERAHPVIQDGYFYFVHGYRPVGVPDDRCLARTSYGADFPSAVGRDACVAVQFHPEKSQYAGLDLLERFCRWQP